MNEYAVIQTGGKQYRVHPGDVIRVEKLEVSPGDVIEITDVRMTRRDDQVKIGAPQVKGSKVVAEVQGHGRGDKITVLKYKRKTRYRKKQGHRQSYTALKITNIQ